MPTEENYDYDYVFDEDDDEESALIDIFNTRNSYNIIYAAPSWKYDQSHEELLKLPVNKVADKNCALFLWIKNNQMAEALNVIDK